MRGEARAGEGPAVHGRATITTGNAVRVRDALIPVRQRWVFVYFSPCVLAVASESSSIDPGEEDGGLGEGWKGGYRRKEREGGWWEGKSTSVAGRSGQLCLHWPVHVLSTRGKTASWCKLPICNYNHLHVESRCTSVGQARSNLVHTTAVEHARMLDLASIGVWAYNARNSVATRRGRRGRRCLVYKPTTHTPVLQLLHNRVKTTGDR